jgi:hypothetical protein
MTNDYEYVGSKGAGSGSSDDSPDNALADIRANLRDERNSVCMRSRRTLLRSRTAGRATARMKVGLSRMITVARRFTCAAMESG